MDLRATHTKCVAAVIGWRPPVGSRSLNDGGRTTPHDVARRHDAARRTRQGRPDAYDAQFGRFSSRDPIGCKGSTWSLYEYVDGMPLIKVDPSGLVTVEICRAQLSECMDYQQDFLRKCTDKGAYRGLRLARKLSYLCVGIPAMGFNLTTFWQIGEEHGRSETGAG